MVKKRNVAFEADDDKAETNSMEDLGLTKRAYEQLSKDNEARERYKEFRVAKFDAKKLEKFLLNRYDIAITEDSSTILATMTKIFAGEVIERARELMTEAKLPGKIRPKFLKLAYIDVRKQFKGPLFKDDENYN